MLSTYLVDKMVESEVIQKEDKDVYLYGLNQGFTIIQNIFITLIIGGLFGNITATCVFLMVYIPLRSFAGGYHAATPKKCFIYSIILILVIQLYFFYLFKSMYQWIYPVVLISSFIIYVNSPIQNSNKPLSIEEKSYYKKVVAEILISVCFLMLFSKMLSCLVAEQGMATAIYIETLLLIIEKFKNRHLQRNKV